MNKMILTEQKYKQLKDAGLTDSDIDKIIEIEIYKLENGQNDKNK